MMKMLSRLVSSLLLLSCAVCQPRALGDFVQFDAKFDNPYIHSKATTSDKSHWYHTLKDHDLGEKTGGLPSRNFVFSPLSAEKPTPAPASKPGPASKSSKKGGKKGKGTCDSMSGKKGGKKGKGKSCQPSKPIPQKPTPKPVPTKPTPQPTPSDGETSSPTRQPISAGLEPTSQPSRYIPTGPSQDMPSLSPNLSAQPSDGRGSKSPTRQPISAGLEPTSQPSRYIPTGPSQDKPSLRPNLSAQPSDGRGTKRPSSTPVTRRPSAVLPTSPPSTTSSPSLDSPAPSTSIEEDASGQVALTPFAVLHTLRGRGDPPSRIEYLAATSVTEDFLEGFFTEIFSETNRINLRKFDLTFNGGTYTSGQPIRVDYKAEAKFDPLARVPKTRELDQLIVAAFQGELMEVLVDALNEKLPASNVLSTAESLEYVEGRSQTATMSATSLALIVAAGAMFAGGILFYLCRQVSKKGDSGYEKPPPSDDSATSGEITTEVSSQGSVESPRQLEYLSPIVEVEDEEEDEQESADDSSLAYSDDSRQSRPTWLWPGYDPLQQVLPVPEESDLESIQL